MAHWRRLADYFIIVGYQHDGDGEAGGGKVIQRFPEKDWPDVPFTPGIELFCQPGGWELTSRRLEPTFFVSVLTDIDGERHYCACLTFHEPFDDQRSEGDEESEEVSEDEMVPHSVMFAPKSIVLISQLDHFDTFKNCLGIIYTVYVEGNHVVPLEELVGNILGCVMIPPAGGPQVRFTIGAGDKQALHPPLNNMIPITRRTVAVLFQELGIHNVVMLVCAALTDHKILFTSRSYNRLADASTALSALLYPLRYSYVYIPILPAALVEVLSTPTPFIAGIHSTVRDQACDLLDVIIVDCDSGSIEIPECVKLPQMPEPMYSRLLKGLSLVLNPELCTADLAFPKDISRTTDAERVDKEIRSVFIRFFAELFGGYRSCLQIVRIHNPPVIQFHKAKFLGIRNLVECEFSKKLLESMCFAAFVQSRGAPFRVCDIFDEVFATLPTALNQEQTDTSLMFRHIREISHTLYLNESPSNQQFTEKIPKPTDGAFTRIHLPKFPILDWLHVQEIIDRNQTKRDGYQKHVQHLRTPSPRIVPIGANVSQQIAINLNQGRRLEVLHNCVRFIFENKISDARKIYPAVVRALKNKAARHALTEDLQKRAQNNKAQLDHQQFLLVVKLLNALLQNESPLDENGIAAQILPLSDTFYRKLTTGIIQFAYTCIQEHPVWSNQQFWEATFYEEVQKEIRNLYQNIYKDRQNAPASNHLNQSSAVGATSQQAAGQVEGQQSETTNGKAQTNQTSNQRACSAGDSSLVTDDVSCLEIAAEELRKERYTRREELLELSKQEEGIVFSQAIHFCNRMVYLKVPLDTSKGMPFMPHGEESTASSNRTPSLADSNSIDAESGFDEAEVSEVGSSVSKHINRFMEKVCRESNVSETHMKNLNAMIPGVVTMHVETIENVCRESKRLPPILKPKITEPCLLPDEELIVDGLRAYLLTDGREEYLSGSPGPQLLPAEGAIFLTTYRVIFKGTPCDQFACEQTVIRAAPVSAISKDKKLSSEYFTPLEVYLQHILQIRAHTFQLMKIGFDEEVGEESIEHFRKALLKASSPGSFHETFAFRGAAVVQVNSDQKRGKEKYHTLRDFGKTLKKTVRKAGLKPNKPLDRRQRYILSGRSSIRGLSPALLEEVESRPGSIYEEDPDNWSRNYSVGTLPPSWRSYRSMLSHDDIQLALQTDPKTQERLSELLCYRDYVRLELIGSNHSIGNRSKTEKFFMSNLNASYKLCHSYPGLLIFPASITDESIMRFGRGHRQNRFPVISWRHPKTKALLLRASGFHSRSVMGKFKSSQTSNTSRDSSSSLSTSFEMEKYLSILCELTPSGNKSSSGDPAASGMSNTMSMTLTPNYDTIIPNRMTGQSSTTSRFMGGMFDKKFSHHSDGISKLTMAQTSSGLITVSARGPRGKSGFSSPNNSRGMTQTADHESRSQVAQAEQELREASLYVFCEKNHNKSMKTEFLKRCEFMSLEFKDVAAVKASYKKLLRACVPGVVTTSPEHSFHKQVEESGWLVQIQGILQYAGAIVDLLDEQGASVILALEEGWDFTSQVMSVAQLLLDPYYRTFEGFRTLIEKEWLSFGHRFSHRGNQTAGTHASSFAPIFLQFLDVVHQVHRQFPLSFEFNQFFLKFLAYHYLSNRFRTFMMDCECDRLEAGWLLDDRPRHGMAAAEISNNLGNSLWDYLDLHKAKSTIFHNVLYVNEETSDMVLRLYSNMANLEVWDYYTEENLAYGPAYDLELVDKETLQARDIDEDLLETGGRVTMNNCYDNVELRMPDIFTALLQEISYVEQDLNQFPSKWFDLLNRIEESIKETFRRQNSLSTQYYKSHGRNAHKRSTMEFLVRGKMLPPASKMFSQPHSFEKYHYNTPTSCDYCSHILWGFMKTGLKCQECGYNCHEKCMSHVPKNCSSSRAKSGVSHNNSEASTNGSTAYNRPTSPSDEDRPIVAPARRTDHRLLEDHMWKQGVHSLLKAWKRRYVVLDYTKYQLRYYDDKEDTKCRGFIDLGDVVQVVATKPVAGAPKPVDDAFFEIITKKRQYVFQAESAEKAQKWIDEIHGRISS